MPIRTTLERQCNLDPSRRGESLDRNCYRFSNFITRFNKRAFMKGNKIVVTQLKRPFKPCRVVAV